MIQEAEIKALIGRGDLLQAARLVSEGLGRTPEDIGGLRLAAEIAFRRGKREEGFAAAMQAVRLCPSDIGYGLDCAFNLVRAGRRDDALAVADIIANQEPVMPDHRDVLGTVYTHCECPEKALPHFRYASTRVPDSPRFRFNLASVLRMIGDREAAEINLDEAIRLDASQGDFYLARAQLRRQRADRNHVEEMKQALRKVSDTAERIPIEYALAKELEDVGQYGEAFSHLDSASRNQRARLRYDPAQDIAMMRRLGDLEYRTPAANAATGPIFVLGMPRSGTTLVERILESTGRVQSAGETNTLAAELWRVATRSGRPADPTSAMIAAASESGEIVGRAYADILSARFDGRRAIDKTPGNYLYAGLISAHVPGARIVCLRRGAMDTCYAMFKTLFAEAYPFTYDLDELAAYYIEWDGLISQWETRLGSAWLTVRYEELVRNPEPAMRSILDHCGLEWADDCLSFHKLTSPVTSASAGQVSEPLNDRSIGLWRQYASELGGLSERLVRAGIALEQ